MKTRIRAVICVLSVFLVLVGFAYIGDYYRATESAIGATERAYNLGDDILVFESDEANAPESGIIFYPGGKVQYEAYAPLMQTLSEEGILSILVQMPANLAVLDMKAADGIQEQFPEITEWYMAGHSLGGSMAASYIEEYANQFEGLILLAAYSTEDLSSTELKVLSVYGTEDKVLNIEKYDEYRENLPENFKEIIIEGGCHSYFGDYGHQEGDGEAKISADEQLKITVEAIKNLVK